MATPNNEPSYTDASFAIEVEISANPQQARESFSQRWQQLNKTDPVMAHRLLRLSAMRGSTDSEQQRAFIDGVIVGIHIAQLAKVLDDLELHYSLPAVPHPTES
jgi:hypothetical protein